MEKSGYTGGRYKVPIHGQSSARGVGGTRYKTPAVEQPGPGIAADLRKLKIIARIFALTFALVVVILLNVSLLQTQVLYDDTREPSIKEINPTVTPTSAP
ncbi:MAG TPA: hypothetical protein DEB24_06635 [Coriobacteriia bacterium]|nr:hypothetical protein [Coriobacteriia bacterium]